LFECQFILPILFLASLILHRRVEGNFDRLLMASRECFLWQKLLERLIPMLGGKYEARYFLTSRTARLRWSLSYAKYVFGEMQGRTLFVDFCGTGRSLAARMPRAVQWILLGYDGCEVEFFLRSGFSEPTLKARHPAVQDVDAEGKPIYIQSEEYWANVPEMIVQEETFMRAVSVVHLHDFKSDFAECPGKVDDTLRVVLFAPQQEYHEASKILVEKYK
jgi:hypothetical protein